MAHSPDDNPGTSRRALGLSDAFFDALSDSQRQRFYKALTADIEVYPVAPHTHLVRSHKSNGDESTYTVYYPPHDSPRCTCQDYLFRGVESSGVHRCKHIWRVRLDMLSEELPPASVHPKPWILAQMRETVFDAVHRLDSLDDSEWDHTRLRSAVESLRETRKRVSEQDERLVNYEEAYSEWRRVRDVVESDDE